MADGLSPRAISRLSIGVGGLLALVGCGGADSEPTWRSVARGFEPTRIAQRTPWGKPVPGVPPVYLVPHEGGTRAEVELTREHWESIGPRVWRAPLPLATVSARGFLQRSVVESVPATLSVDGRRARRFPSADLGRVLTEYCADERHAELAQVLGFLRAETSFGMESTDVLLVLPEGARAPERATLSQPVGGGEQVDGLWRVRVGDLTADGIPVIAGNAEEVIVDIPPESALRVHTVGLGRAEPGTDELLFRVLLDGESILEHRQRMRPEIEFTPHVLPLPAGGRRGAVLAFEVEGAISQSAFVLPTLGPAEVGERGARPWGAAPPDIFFFLADTYRADNLAAWGGDPELTPHFNRLADQSLRFLSARSAATWTLPSHAALFSGMYPPQANVTRREHSLHRDAITLAEHLRDHGYRTVAITERGFVSRTYGLDQGFEWFREGARDLGGTLADARRELAHDDGRPVFFFLHSYHAHIPYEVTGETRGRLGDRYDFSGSDEDLRKRYAALGPAPPGSPMSGERAELMQRLERLYRGASADVDAGFGKLIEELRASGRFERSILVFTSDHGEAFGEHGSHGHGQSAWDEEARVPLLLRAPGLAPRDDSSAACLVDLPRTLCALAGVEPRSEWHGRDLLASPGKTVLSYQCGREAPSQLAIVRGTRKIIVHDSPGSPDHGQLRHAYDLGQDPSEGDDVALSAPWPQQMLADLRGVLDRMSVPLLDRTRANPDEQQRAELEGMGYGGAEDE